ncbi:MAG: TraB/GumN family protein [Gemmobacter sp.]
MQSFRAVLAAVAACLSLAAPAVAVTGCEGEDLIAALPADERSRIVALAEAQPFARGNLWRAQRGEQVVHLVGTYHFDDPRHDAMIARVAPLLEPPARLLVEAGPEEEAQLQAELVARPDFMFLTEGPTLPELLPGSDWQALSDAVRARGIPPFLASRFRPWYLSIVLAMPPCAMEAVARGDRGLDHRIMDIADGNGIPVAALEPFDTLFRIFGTLTLEQELDMVRAVLLMQSRPEDMAVTLADAYFRGESRLLWEFAVADARKVSGLDPAVIEEQFGLMEEVLMNARNRAWIPVILEAAEAGPVVAAFGALHLPGAEGVLALLEAEGFRIERLDR